MRRLRRESTLAERVLWQELRNRKTDGLKWRRQYPLMVNDGDADWTFIADFFCASEKLVIEIDGAVHDGHHDYDAARTAAIKVLGLRVARFTNDDIIQDTQTVIARILSMIGEVDRQ